MTVWIRAGHCSRQGALCGQGGWPQPIRRGEYSEAVAGGV